MSYGIAWNWAKIVPLIWSGIALFDASTKSPFSMLQEAASRGFAPRMFTEKRPHLNWDLHTVELALPVFVHLHGGRPEAVPGGSEVF